jgi:hypothetical protein
MLNRADRPTGRRGILSTPIADLLPPRFVTASELRGISTMQDLARERHRLGPVRNVGPKASAMIDEVLRVLDGEPDRQVE